MRIATVSRPSLRLIRIDDQVARSLELDSDEFERVHEASLGGNRGLVREVVGQTLSLLGRVPRRPEFGGYLAVDEEKSIVIGTCGFRAGPGPDGAIEIAYFTFPEFERRGYATEMARGLIERAVKAGEVQRVIAHTLPERSPSSRVLEKVGMIFVGEVDDPEDGRVWRWERR